jgi:hypothetical protein
MTKNHQIKTGMKFVCMTWVISLPSSHAKSLDHNWLIWVVLLSLSPFLFILGVCVLGGVVCFCSRCLLQQFQSLL